MAIRSITQLKTWFRKGAYPLASQFADWMDSYWHKEEKIPINSVERLAECLNGKYDAAQAKELQAQVEAATSRAEANRNDIDALYTNVEELEAEDERLDASITTETQRATGVEEKLQASITTERSRAEDEETAIRGELQAGDTKTLADAKKYADDKVAGLVNSAPETLDTLYELAQALDNDPNFAAKVAEQIGGKADKTELPEAITGQEIESIFN